MTIENTSLLDSVNRDYFRHLPSKEDGNNVVPAWVGRIERFCLESMNNQQEDLGNGVHEKKAGFVSQITNGLNMFSNSLVLSNRSDAKVFNVFSHSLRCFWPGSALTSIYQRPEHDLADKIIGLHQSGVDIKHFADWFASIRNFAINGDPILFRKMVSPNTIGKPVGALVGLGMGSDVRPDTFYRHAENTAIVGQISEFSSKVAVELGRAGAGKEVDLVAESAQATSALIRRVKDTEFKDVSILRPMPAENLIFSLAHALTSHLGDGHSLAEGESEHIAESVIRGARRKRVAWNKDTVFALIASISDHEFIKPRLNYYSSDTSDMGREVIDMSAGSALEIIDEISPAGSKNKIMSYVMGGLREDLVYQIRLDGMHLFDWDENDYTWFGLQRGLWSKHNERLRSEREAAERYATQGASVIKDGNLVFDYFGEFNPATGSHRAVCEDVRALTSHHLIKSGIVNPGFNAGLNLCVNINTGNKGKKSASPEVRHTLFKKSLQGLNDVFVWEADELSALPTADKLINHQALLKQRGVDVAGMVRVCGTDKLSPSGWYDESREPQGYQMLNDAFPHVWIIQREDMGDIDTLHGKIGMIQDNYPARSVILIPSYLDLHASDFRSNAQRYSDILLSTAVHPSIINDIKQTYS